MDSSTEQHVFDENYDRVLHRLEATSQSDSFSLETINGELTALCVYEGHDWVGRGELKQAEIEGSILAYQVFLRRWHEAHPGQGPATGRG